MLETKDIDWVKVNEKVRALLKENMEGKVLTLELKNEMIKLLEDNEDRIIQESVIQDL